MNNNKYITIASHLQTFNYHYSQNWLEECVDYYLLNNPAISLEELKREVVQQWLLVDLRSMQTSCLPPDLDKIRKVTLPSCYALQVESITDIGNSMFSQYQKIKKFSDCNLDISDGKQNTNLVQSNRCLLLNLCDGVQEIKAMEYRPLSVFQNFKSDLLPGFKIVIKGPVDCRRGMLLLSDSNIQICGGEIDTLTVVNSYENILAKKLGFEQNLTPDINLLTNISSLPHPKRDEIKSRNVKQDKILPDILDLDVNDFEENFTETLHDNVNDSSYKNQNNIQVSNDQPNNISVSKVSRNNLDADIFLNDESNFVGDELERTKNLNDNVTYSSSWNQSKMPAYKAQKNIYNSEETTIKPTNPEGCEQSTYEADELHRTSKKMDINHFIDLTNEDQSASANNFLSYESNNFIQQRKSEFSSDEFFSEMIDEDLDDGLDLDEIKQNVYKSKQSLSCEPDVNVFTLNKSSSLGVTKKNMNSLCTQQAKLNQFFTPVTQIQDKIPKLISPEPFVYLKQIPTNCTSTFIVKAQIMTLKTKLSLKNLKFLQAVICDGSASVDVNFSLDVLENLLGFSACEMEEMMKIKLKNPSMGVRVRQAFEQAQQKLISLNCLMKIKFNDNELPLVLTLEELCDKHYLSLHRRQFHDAYN